MSFIINPFRFGGGGNGGCQIASVSASKNYDGATHGKRAGFGGTGTVGIFSMWGKDLGGNTIFQQVQEPGPSSRVGMSIRIASGGKLRFSVTKAAATQTRIDLYWAGTATPGQHNHFLAVWDSLDYSKNLMFLNGIDRSNDSSVSEGDTLGYQETTSYFGARRFPPSAVGGWASGCISHFYLNFQEYVDISDDNVLGKFYCSGRPADLGADGSLPTGNAPDVFLPDGDFTDNKGTAGDWTLDAGSLTNCSDVP